MSAQNTPFAGTFNMAEYSAGLVREAPDRAQTRANKVHAAPPRHDGVFTAVALKSKVCTPISYVIHGLMPDGLSMLVGRPKIGKSWLALDAALAVASKDGTCLGGRKVEHGNVLYCACEDSERRLQSRITKLIGVHRNEWPADLQSTTGCGRLVQGGGGAIADRIKSVKHPRFVILDTLASVKPQRSTQGYAEDYAALEELHRLANDVGIAVLILHHQRKSEADDPLDTISGTLGLAGCVDTPIILSGTSQGMTLYVRGRDIEEAEHAVSFDKATCRWTIKGDAAEVRMSDTKKKILDALKTASGDGMGPSDIAAATGIDVNTIKQRLHHMTAANEVKKRGPGRYVHPDRSDVVTSVTS